MTMPTREEILKAELCTDRSRDTARAMLRRISDALNGYVVIQKETVRGAYKAKDVHDMLAAANKKNDHA
jgi:hypothetical protein